MMAKRYVVNPCSCFICRRGRWVDLVLNPHVVVIGLALALMSLGYALVRQVG